jgi:MFS transporter, UMF1 family
MQKIQAIIGIRGRQQWAWVLYDWANSAFATTIMAVLLPIYFFDVAAVELEPSTRTAYWGYTSALSLLFIALASPVLGAIADIKGSKKKNLFWFMIIGILGTTGLFWVQRGDWMLAALCYLVANVGWAGSLVFYDALIVGVAKQDEIDGLSIAGFAIGYLGGGVLLAINLMWVTGFEGFGFSDKGQAVRYSFMSVAVWWFIFAIPTFIYVKEPAVQKLQAGKLKYKEVFTRLVNTLKAIAKDKTVFWFLIAFWLYSDGIGTIIKMATSYGREIGIEQDQLIKAMLMVQILGLPLTLLYIPLLKLISARKALIMTLLIYSAICVLGYYMTTASHFWLLAGMVALVQGGSQALSRSIYTRIIPKARSAEYFAFFSVSAKFAGIIGPLMFAVIAQMYGGSRLSILSIVFMFAFGIWILQTKLKDI